jgi:uncharacterized delta-60 repeat protein
MFKKKSSSSVRINLRRTTLALCLSASAFASANPGDLNRHFGTAGTATIPADVSPGWNEHVVVDGSNRIVFGYNVNPDSAEIGALDASGHVDTTFGTDGFLELGDFQDIKVDSLDRYVVLGHAVAGTHGVTVLRYLHDGSVDTSFGTGGIATVATDAMHGGTALALDDDDNIVIVGGKSMRLAPDAFYAARLLNNGSLDLSFGKDGLRTVILPSGGETSTPESVAIDHIGNVYLTGYTNGSPAIVNQLIKLKPDGNLDKHFGGTGIVTTDLNPSTDTHFTFAQSVAVDAKDNVVIAGGAGSFTTSQTFVARFLPDGMLDPTFNGGAYASFPVGASVISQAQTALIDSRGRIVLTGVANDGGPDAADFFAVRLKKDGQLDTSFTGGILPTSGWRGAGALTNDGDVLVFGDSTTPDSMLIDELKGNSKPASAADSDDAEG